MKLNFILKMKSSLVKIDIVLKILEFVHIRSLYVESSIFFTLHFEQCGSIILLIDLVSALLYPRQVRLEDGREGHREQLERRSTSDHPQTRYRRPLPAMEERALHTDPD